MAVVHRVYAEALLAAAKDAKQLDRVREEFGDLAAAVEQSEELRRFLRNPQIESRLKRETVEELLADADERFANFARLLAEKGRIGELEEVHREFERLLAAEEQVLEVDLTTAVELTDEEEKSIVADIEKATDRRIEATRHVDPSLIGGMVVQVGSLRLDGSVRGRLDKLREELLVRG